MGNVVGLTLVFCTQGCVVDPGPSRWIFHDAENRQRPCRRLIPLHIFPPFGGMLYPKDLPPIKNTWHPLEWYVGQHTYTRAFGDGPRNFEPWSSDVDDT
ncbi:hypothetical protein TNCV_2191191 [Trichonephila clavipes]|nr:hypothetical protein TNCV_2191191 [Trichonephila clavipes]